MEELMQSVMKDGETILWHGKPEQFEFLDRTHKAGYIRKCVISTAVAIAIIVAYVIAASGNRAGIKPGVIIVIAGCALYAIAMPFVNAFQLRRSVEYVITDRRLAVLRGTVSSVEYDKISIAAMRRDEDGHSTLLCGNEALKTTANKWRADTLIGARTDTDTGECTSLVMYAIAEPDKVKEVLKPYLTLN